MTAFQKANFEQLLFEIEDCTDNNWHTEALIELAKFFNLEKIEKALRGVETLHDYMGHLTPELMFTRNKLTEDLEKRVAKLVTKEEFKRIMAAF